MIMATQRKPLSSCSWGGGLQREERRGGRERRVVEKGRGGWGEEGGRGRGEGFESWGEEGGRGEKR